MDGWIAQIAMYNVAVVAIVTGDWQFSACLECAYESRYVFNQAYNGRAPGALKLLLSGKSVCMCVSLSIDN